MTIAWFLIFDHPTAALSEPDGDRLATILAATPDLIEARILTPAATRDPYLDDGAPPPLALQLDFPDITHLEAALAEAGHLHALAGPGALPSLAGATATQQAMLARHYPVPDPILRTAPGTPHCTYLVTYEIEAEDPNAWLRYYVAHHPGIMARFPAIRAIAIYTRADWICATPWPRATALQRNKVVFDDPQALTAALNSPVRHDMRGDFHQFPASTGRNTHYPMHTRLVPP